MVSFRFLINALVAEKIDFKNCLKNEEEEKIKSQISQQLEHLNQKSKRYHFLVLVHDWSQDYLCQVTNQLGKNCRS